MTIDLNSMTLKELKDLQARVTREVNDFKDRKRREALSALEEKARELGFNFSELTGATKQRKRSPALVKFVNPNNRSETWSGRGRKPLWFVAALNAGVNPDSMSV